jgi:hypothetical protein
MSMAETMLYIRNCRIMEISVEIEQSVVRRTQHRQY